MRTNKKEINCEKHGNEGMYLKSEHRVPACSWCEHEEMMKQVWGDDWQNNAKEYWTIYAEKVRIDREIAKSKEMLKKIEECNNDRNTNTA